MWRQSIRYQGVQKFRWVVVIRIIHRLMKVILIVLKFVDPLHINHINIIILCRKNYP
jgi:hypothetical protein